MRYNFICCMLNVNKNYVKPLIHFNNLGGSSSGYFASSNVTLIHFKDTSRKGNDHKQT